MNPQHTVPTLDDNGTIIWDSHAICTYLIEKYAPNDALYPKNLAQRAKVDQRLHFDSGVLFAALINANKPIYVGGCEVPQERIDAIYPALDLLETFLKEDNYLVGNSLTVADFCCATTTTATAIHGIVLDAERYPKILAWLERLKELPYFERLQTIPCQNLIKYFAEKVAANKLAKEA